MCVMRGVTIFEHLTLGICSGQWQFNSLFGQMSPTFHEILDFHQWKCGNQYFSES